MATRNFELVDLRKIYYSRTPYVEYRVQQILQPHVQWLLRKSYTTDKQECTYSDIAVMLFYNEILQLHSRLFNIDIPG